MERRWFVLCLSILSSCWPGLVRVRLAWLELGLLSWNGYCEARFLPSDDMSCPSMVEILRKYLLSMMKFVRGCHLSMSPSMPLVAMNPMVAAVLS